MTDIFLSQGFTSFTRKERINDQDIKDAVSEMDKGLIDVTLGNGLYKKRIARKGQGKRGSYRVIIAFRSGKNVFLLYGFTKNERDNIKELLAFRALAKVYFNFTESDLQKLVASNKLRKVCR
ncbi:type II toxin-antitoxin system RelE/ParE family toxin [Yersinia enterocolitica]|uniref:type II toxin-antitoxin system RelE/ParE family toxin n=1 Tax=Yersinia enterocolitica TaxID=630 RepID=UPI001C8DBABC|nr:type II toxin-antitoxin system RelE/ParE family toxin [Yersinia enterocolitica]MBX9497673.1 type II toxin-antitoxin system RelE/ParE family toxin [Yersinia enterocolitica]